MTTTYTWSVVQMDAYPQENGEQDVVFTVHWNCFGSDGTYNGNAYGSTSISNDAKTPFTPYSQLTQEQVIGWVQSAMGIDEVTKLQENIDAQIAAQVNPPVVTPPLPWAVPVL